MADKLTVESIKTKNVIDMGLTFSAMMRLFSKGSKGRIAAKLEEIFGLLDGISTLEHYQDLHHAFCMWFTTEISTAPKKFRNGASKESHGTSYGQAAKVIDIAAKVYVYYCGLPSPETSGRIVRFLKGAVDTPIMNHLADAFPDAGIRTSTIQNVDQVTYDTLQLMVARDITRSFQNSILPVQYDDIMWYRLNRADQDLLFEAR